MNILKNCLTIFTALLLTPQEPLYAG
ncbi:MAG: hypothetical protein RLZZ162_2285, partial [Verrucomicrobiota bacterium]